MITVTMSDEAARQVQRVLREKGEANWNDQLRYQSHAQYPTFHGRKRTYWQRLANGKARQSLHLYGVVAAISLQFQKRELENT